MTVFIDAQGHLGELLDLNSDQLRQQAAASTGALDLDFLLWLASRFACPLFLCRKKLDLPATGTGIVLQTQRHWCSGH